jgi:hypothetical protein
MISSGGVSVMFRVLCFTKEPIVFLFESEVYANLPFFFMCVRCKRRNFILYFREDF